MGEKRVIAPEARVHLLVCNSYNSDKEPTFTPADILCIYITNSSAR